MLSFFAKKGCEGASFGVNYADIFRHKKIDILTFFEYFDAEVYYESKFQQSRP